MLMFGVEDNGSVSKNVRTRSQGVTKSGGEGQSFVGLVNSLIHCVTRTILGIPVIADFVSGKK